MNKLLEAALDYQSKGWSIVPLAPGEKYPCVPWTHLHKEAASKEQVCEWWDKYPNANVGIVTGAVSNMVVVDIDIKNGKAQTPPADILKVYPTDLISRTGGGGFHLFYEFPEGEPVGNKVGVMPGVDIRADGGLVVAPPSIHSSGRRYVWAQEGPTGPTPLPLLKTGNSKSKSQDSSPNWVSSLLNGVSSGGRNDACARLAGYFAKKEIPIDIVKTMLLDWDTRNSPPLGSEEVEQTIASVYNGHISRKSAKSVVRQNPDLPQEGADNGFALINFNQYMVEFGGMETKWQIKDWMPEKTIVFLVSSPGVYKTWMLLDLAISVASGEPFLGQYPVLDKGPVILIQQEDHHGSLADRLGVIAQSRFGLNTTFDKDTDNFSYAVPPTIPVYVHPDRSLRFDNEESLNALEEHVAKIRPKLVILDPLYSAGSTDDFMAKTAEQMFVFKRWRDMYGTAFLIAHHKKKGGEGREAAWGSQFLNAFLETGWQVTPGGPNNQIVINRHFKAGGVVPDLRLHFDINTERMPYRYGVRAEVEGGKDVTVLGAIKAEGSILQAELAKRMSDDMGRATVYRKVASLVKEGKIKKEGNVLTFVGGEDAPSF